MLAVSVLLKVKREQDEVHRANRFFDFIEVTPGETPDRFKSFLRKGQENPRYVLNCTILFLQAQREKIESKKLAAGTVKNHVNEIKLLCEVCEHETSLPLSETLFLEALNPYYSSNLAQAVIVSNT